MTTLFIYRQKTFDFHESKPNLLAGHYIIAIYIINIMMN